VSHNARVPDIRVALVTGAGRRGTIGTAVVHRLAADGYDVAFTSLPAYDAQQPWGADEDGPAALVAALEAAGRRALALETDLAADGAPAQLVRTVTDSLGAPYALVLSHTYCVPTTLLDTTAESFDRHFAVNVRATFLLVQEFARRRLDAGGGGRVVALTSDHSAGNLPYGASKGALDRIVTATGIELAARGLTGNAINPGPTDTGWITDDLRPMLLERAPAGRLSTSEDAANLVSFLVSDEGGWINGQVLHSNGGWSLQP
jgi:3-oxoacyl-[acyl-carrier protein] reductase